MEEKIITFIRKCRLWMSDTADIYQQLQEDGDWDTTRRRNLDVDVKRIRWIISMLYNTRYLIGSIDFPELNTLDADDSEIDQIISDWSYYLGFDAVGSLNNIAFIIPKINILDASISPTISGSFIVSGGEDGWLLSQQGGEAVWIPKPTVFDAGEL